MKWVLILVWMFYGCFANVHSAEQMIILKKGQTAPYEGILSNGEQMKKFRHAHESLELCADKSSKQKELQKLQSLEKDHYKKKYEDLQVTHKKHKIKSWWAKTGYFLLGVAITGMISYGAMKYGPRR